MDKYVFYGKASDTKKDSLINLMSVGMEKSFSLPPISLSVAEKEIRIYYTSTWYERFYLERFRDDSIEIALYKCGSDRRGDSIFMIIKECIKATGKYNIKDITNTDFLPLLKDCQPEDTVLYLDKGFVYFIETKSAQTVKKILINDNCFMLQSDKDVTHINNFLQSIDKSFNLSFRDSWDQLDSMAFKSN